ncbi:MAG: metallophosphoesterase [Halioglobus sp.]|nr:metallophosphoesterase [Halioglobus sp.]
MRRRYQVLLIVLLLHVPLFGYPVLRLCHWLGLDAWQTTVIFVPLFFSQIVARLYLRHANSGPVFWLRRGADLWLGVSPLLLGMLLLAEVVVALGWLAPQAAAWTLIATGAALMLYSMANAYSPAVVTVQLSSRKLGTPLRFAQITDVHIGSRSQAFLERVMHRVNQLDISFLCITGDFIDAPDVSEQQLSALRECPVPIYFSIGNHERYEDLDDILQRLDRLGVRVLRSQAHFHEDVQLIGIDDSEHPGQVRREIADMAVDRDRFVLLLYHRPYGLTAAAEAGVDLMISGHTHNGQVVPFNFIVGMAFKRVVGLFEHGLTHLYVSPGTGTWGPVMRLGSRGEVTLFDIQPAGDANQAATASA